MSLKIAQNLMNLFFLAPTVNAILVFDDTEYLGALLKRDLEIGIKKKSFEFFENINLIRMENLEQFVLNDFSKEETRIPVVDKTGELLRIISYREFLSQFHFGKFLQDFQQREVWDYMDHPIIITNHFKKILYLNRQALNLTKKDLIGQRFSRFLKYFDIKIKDDTPLLQHHAQAYRLQKDLSESKEFFYRIYQLFPVNP